MRNTPTTERETLFVTDEELMRRLGVSPQIGRPALQELDRDTRSCFPKKDPLWGNRRYWPAVKMFLDRTHGLYPQGDAQGLRNAGNAYTRGYGKATEAHDRRRVPQGVE